VLRVLQPSEATVPLGAALLEVGDMARMEVVAEVLTTEAMRLQPGQLVHIERWGGPGELLGRVRLVEPGAFTKISALGVEEQRVRVLIDFTSPIQQWQSLGDGFRVGVRIVVQAESNAVQVPLAAVFPRANAEGMAVFVLQEGRARLQALEIAARSTTHAWVRAGLSPGAHVIVYPPAATVDGARVRDRMRYPDTASASSKNP
jgi:HlyD family secretion protein